jgi:pimeloyl-ACP methyl ester carboxylesterase/DNA-binding winged helix-turn-helix (wHTH) protein
LRYVIGDCMLDTERFVVEQSGQPVHVQPQVFDVLAYLLEKRDRMIPKEELLDSIWGNRFVSESALTSRIKSARRLVGDDGIAQRCIKTVHGRGYRWIGHVTVSDAAVERPPRQVPPPSDEQRICFCRTPDGGRIAYATVGNGPPLVRAAHWITHLEYDWRSPVWRHWLEDLSRHRTLVRYDERGCGLSDHDPYEISFELFVQDLETVVDALALERFPLVGVSQGGPVAVEYARRHPDRVSHLVLIGAYVKGGLTRATTPELEAEHELQRNLIRAGWGLDDPSHRLYFTSKFIPDADPELWADFAVLLRRTTSAENALRIVDACATIDVGEAATEVAAPTLILHARDELRIPFGEALEFASLIPGSRLVPLDSRNHLLRPDEPAWQQLLAELDHFLGDQ